MKGKAEMTESQTASRAETAGSQDAVGPQGEDSQTAGEAGSGHPDSGLWKSLLPSLAGLPSLQANDQTQGISAGAWVQIPAQLRCAWKVWASCIPPRAPVFLTCNEGCNSFARGLLGPRNELTCFEQGLAQSEWGLQWFSHLGLWAWVRRPRPLPVLRSRSAPCSYVPKLISVVETSNGPSIMSREAWHDGKTLTLD